ncbi:ethanolamine utilization protein PduL [Enterococcus moraviensis ATCC BAA-383]|uniref:Phosphate propanoyltransferase n=1 Tax=Enterococcus moraviensis ATCC BAA-383 TaxID=1158609 RepID=R2R2L3_9ENTE|nr:ethanolamine utilization phosphate acetyltransferase EutD [Enterococcus moraviensis]EOI01896.1 ethanolamine utilization protein PduL [Enterococcus moraviensis ATCC BAA-383]EOT73569.1 ethanolamine utilization protein PduL [Enterococcus moraviensis ATCC BAA-383]OJG69130.1 ethanolamine utilization protein PduL [Enterococcus moraviensis]
MNEELINTLVDQVITKINEERGFLVEASGRHVHLSQEHIDRLFGKGYQLTIDKYLSQPGQYASKERLTIMGPKGALHNVVILGPARKASQVEVSGTDALALGVKVPVRESGDIEGTPGVVLINGSKMVALEKGLIIAKRHVHVAAKDAVKMNVVQGEIVKVRINSEQRSLIFDDVVIRVSDKFATAMHIDYDEANACSFKKGTRGYIVK